MSGRVTLVGAGPGDAGLLTVRGQQRLQQADVVVHDRLIGPDLLELAPPTARLVDAGKAPGRHKLTQDEINALLVREARDGHDVMRLKGGDPFLYGRGWEELQACRAAEIPCEVVPGISSALAVPAAAGIPVTARGIARSVTIATPQTPNGAELDTLDFKALAASDTLTLFMSRSCLPQVAERLIEAGRAGDTPAAVIENGTLPQQRQVVGTLATIARQAADADLQNPSLVVIGEVAALARTEAGGTLDGLRVLVTRPRTASGNLIRQLRARGAEVLDVPLIEIDTIEPIEWTAPSEFDWLVFTSLHGVRGFLRALDARGLDGRALGKARMAAVGPKTAGELRRGGLRADLVPREYRATALVQAVADAAGPGARVLFPCGTLALEEVPRGLRSYGLRVEPLHVYQTRARLRDDGDRRQLRRGIDAALLYSPSAAGSLVENDIQLEGALLAAIGPTTAEALRKLGLTVDAVPQHYSDAGMISVLEQHVAEVTT